jgi:hypothetical protein
VRPLTDVEEWRRRVAAATTAIRPGDLRTAATGLAALDREDLETVRVAAAVVAARVWDQPEDVPGVVVADGVIALAHTSGQPFSHLGLAIGFLALAFEALGDDELLEAAVELHDLTVALGDALWTGPEGWRVGWGSAVLFEVTGEVAYRATAERVADGICEAQRPDGSWGSGLLDLEAATILTAMANAVDARIGLDDDPPPDAEDANSST